MRSYFSSLRRKELNKWKITHPITSQIGNDLCVEKYSDNLCVSEQRDLIVTKNHWSYRSLVESSHDGHSPIFER